MRSDKLPNSQRLFLGIDQSLSCTSLCLLQNQEIRIRRIKPTYMGVSRIDEIYTIFNDFLDETTCPVYGAAIEGYAHAATGAVFNLGELGGVLRLGLYQRKIATAEVPPTTLKKHLVGKGNAPKNLMMKELYKKYELDLNDDNDCDAVALAIVAQEYFEETFHAVKAYRTDLHKTCKQIIGEHPNPMNVREYYRDMPNVTVAEYEKIVRRKKKEASEL